MTQSLRAYRSSVTEAATHLDLLIAVYDALAEDVRLAGNAAGTGRIAERCRRSLHALQLVGHLESWVPLLEEPVLQESLNSFYAYLRSELIRLQSATDTNDFPALAMRICETRAAWQQKRSQSCPPIPPSLAEPRATDTLPQDTGPRFFWSA